MELELLDLQVMSTFWKRKNPKEIPKHQVQLLKHALMKAMTKLPLEFATKMASLSNFGINLQNHKESHKIIK